MTKLTENEVQMLKQIPQDNFFDGDTNSREDLGYLLIWTDCFLDECGMEVRAAKGVLGSLTKKGYVEVSGGKDSTIGLTPKAIDYLLSRDTEESSNIEIDINDIRYKEADLLLGKVANMMLNKFRSCEEFTAEDEAYVHALKEVEEMIYNRKQDIQKEEGIVK